MYPLAAACGPQKEIDIDSYSVAPDKKLQTKERDPV
jgi:hypothetical protein